MHTVSNSAFGIFVTFLTIFKNGKNSKITPRIIKTKTKGHETLTSFHGFFGKMNASEDTIEVEDLENQESSVKITDLPTRFY